MKKRILITGAAGFIGHHFVDHFLKNTDDEIIIIDRLDESGNLNRLAEVGCPNRRVKYIHHNLRAEINSLLIKQIGQIDIILHLGAATHVDRSISDPMSFVQDNIVATVNLLNYARVIDLDQFIYFSTDEVFGPAPPDVFYKEWDRYNAGNPYSATKAGAEELCIAYHNTYKLPVKITHCMNVFGERQHPEKFIPMVISNVRDGKSTTIHSDHTKTIPGSRFYIHAGNVIDGVLFVMEKGDFGDKFNIVGEKEVDNLTLAKMIAEIQGKPLNYEMVDFHSSRPGHDLRYAMDGSKLAGMGWIPRVNFEQSLKNTVHWTLKNEHWLL